MCDACIGNMRRQIETLTIDQKAAVDAYMEHEIEQAREEIEAEGNDMKELVDEASGKLVELRAILAEKPLDQDTEIAELPKMIEAWHRAIAVIDEIGPLLERTV